MSTLLDRSRDTETLNGKPIRHPWVYRAPRYHLVILATFCGIATWACMAGMDVLAAQYDGPRVVVPMATLDSIIGILFGVVLLKLMLSQRARHRRFVERFEIIAEMNHHIRNALDQIQLSAHFAHNQQLTNQIDTAVERIEWALRVVLPGRVGADPSEM